MKNKVVREVVDFIKGHQFLFDQVLHEDVSRADELTMERVNLVVGILSKVLAFILVGSLLLILYNQHILSFLADFAAVNDARMFI